MLRATRALIFDTVSDIPSLIKSDHSAETKWQIFLTYLRISIKLFTIQRFKKITEDEILGMKVSFFDYGTLHFLYREIFMRNIYYFKSKKKNPLIIDCGANIGIATLFFKWLYPRSTIYTIEADKETFALLEKNIKQNKFKNIHLHNIAVWGKKEKINFYIDKTNPGWLTMSTLKERLPKDKITVDAMPLSTFIPKNTQIDFLKMDVEGIETKIIKELITSKKIQAINEMVIEYHHGIDEKKLAFSKFLEMIEKNGFLYRIGTTALPFYQKHVFQDINIYIHK
jgi:FkbM family methyltransferase